MDIIEINNENIGNEHICCALGSDKTNKKRASQKKEWMKTQFDNGLVFKRLNERGKVFIEYMPIEHCWKPLAGENYMVINCLWVSGRFKKHGYSTQLLNMCIADARSKGMDGVCVVSSSKVKPFLTDRKFFLKKGFVLIDSAEPYFELLSLKFNDSKTSPVFTENAKLNKTVLDNGFTFIYSDQCPFMEDLVGLYKTILENRGIVNKSVKLKSSKDVKDKGSPFGTMGIYYKGDFLTHELMTEKKFEELVDKCIK